jgi:hypothetical protein
MTLGAIGPGAVTPLPGSAAAAVAWRARDQLHLTVIVKATFDGAAPSPELTCH